MTFTLRSERGILIKKNISLDELFGIIKDMGSGDCWQVHKNEIKR